MERWNGATWWTCRRPSPAPRRRASSAASRASARCSAGRSGLSAGSRRGWRQFPAAGHHRELERLVLVDRSQPQRGRAQHPGTISCVPAVGCIAAGTAAVQAQTQNDPGLRTFVEQMAFPRPRTRASCWRRVTGASSTTERPRSPGPWAAGHLNAPVVGIAATPDGGGYWRWRPTGGSSTSVMRRSTGPWEAGTSNAPVVGIAATPDGRGYWLVAADGGVFNFGDADVLRAPWAVSASMPRSWAWRPPAGAAIGWWHPTAGSSTSVNAGFFGSTGGQRLNAPVAGIAATPDGGGYWLVGSDGGVFNYGNAGFYGSVPGQGIVGQPPVVGISRTPERSGLLAGGFERCRLRLRGRGVPRIAERNQAERPGIGHRIVGGAPPAAPQTKSEPPSTLTQAPVT